MKHKTTIAAILGSLLLIQVHQSHGQSAASQKEKGAVPVIDGDWWPVAGNPDLGYLNGKNQQPVDFGIWRAKDGSWQLWSCIRSTKEPGKTRLFYGWQAASLLDSNWSPQGIKMRADPLIGETAGGIQAPFVLYNLDSWDLFYGDWNAICSATSRDGKVFKRTVQHNQSRVTAMFTQGAGTNTRDPMVLEFEGIYYCYYTAGTGFRDEGANEKTGAVYCRTSRDKKHWSSSRVVSRGGRSGSGWGDHECPFVIRRGHFFYLFRTQHYGKNNVSAVYRSSNPLDFGINHERLFCRNLTGSCP
jgi:hypothetical protein